MGHGLELYCEHCSATTEHRVASTSRERIEIPDMMRTSKGNPEFMRMRTRRCERCSSRLDTFEVSASALEANRELVRILVTAASNRIDFEQAANDIVLQITAYVSLGRQLASQVFGVDISETINPQEIPMRNLAALAVDVRELLSSLDPLEQFVLGSPISSGNGTASGEIATTHFSAAKLRRKLMYPSRARKLRQFIK